MKTVVLKIIQGIGYFFAILIIVVAVLVSVARLATPLLNKHHSDIEGWASDLLQVPVSIGEVHANWRGYVPEFSLSNVVTLDKQTHKPAFEIREIKIGFQLFMSLWRRQIVLHDIIISGAHVTVLKDASGKLAIKDMPAQQEQGFKAYELRNILNWVFSQRYLSLRDIDVAFIAFKEEQKDLSLHTVTLWNDGEQHKVNGSFVLHQDIPTEVKMQLLWQGRPDDLAQVKGHAYFHVEGFSLPQWLKDTTASFKELFSGWQIHHGVGGADLWFDWENQQVQAVQSIFQWYDLEFYSEFEKKTYPIARLSGHVGWKRDGDKQIFAGDNFLIDFPDRFWPATTFYVVVAPRPAIAVNNKASWQLEELRMGYIDFQDILPLVLANASLPDAWRKALITLDPSGELRNVKLFCQGGVRDLSRLFVSGEINQLGFHPWQKLPGLKNLSAKLEWNGKSGNARVASHGLVLTWRSLFAEPLLLDEVTAHLEFQQDKEGVWSFIIPDLMLANADVTAKTFLEMTFPLTTSPVINLKGTFSLMNAAHVGHYLPTTIMDHDLVTWLKSAFLGGRLEAGTAIIRGRLQDFPFDQNHDATHNETGSFDVSGTLKNVDFHYAPGWPIIRQANGLLRFSGRSMRALIDSAFIVDIPLQQISGIIPYIGNDKAQILGVQGKITSDLARAMDFIQQSPLEKTIGQNLSAIQLAGPSKLDLSLSIPLANPDKTKVLGEVQVSQGSLALPDWKLALEKINGSFLFTEREVSAEKLQGSLWGEPTLLRLSTVQAKKGLPSYVQAQVFGKVDVAHLDAALNIAFSQFLSGATTYQASLKLYNAASLNNSVELHSDLQGIQVDLPAPFSKAAALKRGFSLNFEILETPPFTATLKYGNLVNARFTIATEKDFRSIDIDSQEVKGRIRVAYPFNAKQPVQAQLEKLSLAAGNTQTISAVNPQSVPPLVITAKQFSYGNKNLGQLTLNTQPKANGMLIQDFNLTAADYYFKSQGEWTGVNAAQNSQLRGTLQSSNVRRFLERFGVHSGSLIVDKGQAAFNLQWKGPPYAFSLANMGGDFSFALEKGRIINLNASSNNKMDIGRMLSLFSLQTIPRRLSGDFSDLVEQGYSFDFIRGDFILKQGDAFTQREAVLEGPVARVTASGRIGLLRQDYDLKLRVSPYVTESLPVVAGAITLNPLVGAAAWLVNKMVLSKEVSKAITYNYTVTGPWTSPVWQSSTPPTKR